MTTDVRLPRRKCLIQSCKGNDCLMDYCPCDCHSKAMSLAETAAYERGQKKQRHISANLAVERLFEIFEGYNYHSEDKDAICDALYKTLTTPPKEEEAQ